MSKRTWCASILLAISALLIPARSFAEDARATEPAPKDAQKLAPSTRLWAIKADGGVTLPRSRDAAFADILGVSYMWSARAHRLVPLAAGLMLQLGVGVSTQAFLATPSETLTTRNRSTTLRTPVSLAYQLGSSKRALRVFAGPWVGFFLFGSELTQLQDVEVVDGEEGDELMDAGFIRAPTNRDAITPVDVGAVAGIALDLGGEELGAVLELRYDLEFTRYARTQANQTRLSSVGLGLGVSF